MNDMGALVCIEGNVVEGTQAASGRKHLSAYGGTIALQKPFFDRAGVDCSSMHNGTINVDIRPSSFHVLRPCLELRDIQWHPEKPGISETFWFIDCTLEFEGGAYGGYFYYPHPSTKVGSFPGYQMMEIFCPFVNGIFYGCKVKIFLPRENIRFIAPPLPMTQEPAEHASNSTFSSVLS